eukprot:765834-Hanusia_phi.AAC.1
MGLFRTRGTGKCLVLMHVLSQTPARARTAMVKVHIDTSHLDNRPAAVAPLKFFNMRTCERFVFKRRDKRCLTLPPRSSIVPALIHFSDLYPDVVHAVLDKCREVIEDCQKVFVLKPRQDHELFDTIVWEGPGRDLPEDCWRRQGAMLRCLDMVVYKVHARDRRRELLKVELQLWSVIEPCLMKIASFADKLTEQSFALENLRTVEEGMKLLASERPWSVHIKANHTDKSPTVGDREHYLHFNPKAGIFVRKYVEDQGSMHRIPLITSPFRLQSILPKHPQPKMIVSYLSTVTDRFVSEDLCYIVKLLDDSSGCWPKVRSSGRNVKSISTKSKRRLPKHCHETGSRKKAKESCEESDDKQIAAK